MPAKAGIQVVLSLSSMAWIPASAGMTDSGPLVTGFRNALPVLVLPLIENRFWTRVILEIYPKLGSAAVKWHVR